ncbi:phosphoribosylformylglycinamidine synthase subunit PurS [Candidatus Omnitrophota bacterium]
MIEAKIFITLKKTVADPQGLTIKHALESLGFNELGDVRIGKLITLKLKTNNKNDSKKQIDEMCKKLLANPVIEDYSFQISEA